MPPRQIVIDSDVICSAGVVHHGTTRPAMCGRFLVTARDHGHVVVITSVMLEEWRRRQSRFSSTWLTSMFARKQVRRVTPTPLHIRVTATGVGFSETEMRACEKDAHVIGAALASDKRVASLDEFARSLFRRIALSSGDGAIGAICWVNPEHADEDAEHWLERGAPDEAARHLAAE